jgi:hypothetical protein
MPLRAAESGSVAAGWRSYPAPEWAMYLGEGRTSQNMCLNIFFDYQIICQTNFASRKRRPYSSTNPASCSIIFFSCIQSLN